ncbi:AbiJ-NTD4 domain-containing protein [Gemmobacter serpentinus]|uniref:AbiJ-NTD4 domain-containing protein n=1 Tax=Gemmobacter serpentinus TaxID=2652247 RepID=UPI00124E5306|nr:hypothetical protein [Gemmobacter serpentinus]
MNTPESSFSDRFGYRAPESEITVREDAPPPIRDGIMMAGYGADLGPNRMRDILCQVLLRRPDPSNWSDSNVEREVAILIDEAPWYRVYDFAEHLYGEIGTRKYTSQARFEMQLNQLFREHGVGWEMKQGCLVARGSEAFALATGHATQVMQQHGAPTAATEIHEALKDISRRPIADVTGAIQHAMAALECVMREVSGTNETLGQAVKRLNLPPPLDQAVTKLWGFSSEQGRHILEGGAPRFEEAELVVTTASALSVYLLRQRDALNE